MKDTVLITGASSGIGFELAKIFAKDNVNLILVARNLDKLNDLKLLISKSHPKTTIYTISKDLSKKSSAKELYNCIKDLNLTVNILVNNAGFGSMGKFIDLDLDTQLEMIELNILTLTKLTHLFLQDMRKLKKGKILNIASLAAFCPGPYMSVYYATKSFVLSFSRALKEELRFSGITVTALCPGATKSQFSKTANANTSLLFLAPMSTKRVALTGYYSSKLGISLFIPGILNKVFALWLKLTPSILNMQFVRLISLKFNFLKAKR
ncbi:MAG: SDR family NAD(P)-dependent oxidoreductase [Sarcina sp.]